MDSIQNQIKFEQEHHSKGMLKGLQQLQDARMQGRSADLPAGKLFLLQNHEKASELIHNAVHKKVRGLHAKYAVMLRRVPTPVLSLMTLRVLFNACAHPDFQHLQDVIRQLGDALESEYIISVLEDEKPWYLEKIQKQITNEHITSSSFIRRKFITAMMDCDELDVHQWTVDERVGCARLLMDAVWPMGIFWWKKVNSGKGRPYNCIQPSEEMRKYLDDVVEYVRPKMQFPPMAVPPKDWTSMYEGGYLSEDMQALCPMMTTKGLDKTARRWIRDNLAEGKAQEAKDAMNKAQNVPYVVNKKVLEIARAAMSNPHGILGLPAHGEQPKPVFPFPADFDSQLASVEELKVLHKWKADMKVWYQSKRQNNGRKIGLHQKLMALLEYAEWDSMYYPTYLDWRGRLYFRSTLTPQAHDMVKGCLDFKAKYPIGERGLFWLKAQVAACCGYDKHTPELKAQWCDDNWPVIENFLQNPLEIPAPEADTAFTLLQAGYALQEALALPDPTKYECSVPVAQDATCSGLQHWSALMLDPIGAKFTNLTDSGRDQKEDIYAEVKSRAQPRIAEFANRKPQIKYWQEHEITRGMAKRPVMTYVYSSTLVSTMEYLAADMMELGWDTGNTNLTHRQLATPAGKALRWGVESTVPLAVIGMKYLKKLVWKAEGMLRWFSPVGVPVVNWSDNAEVKSYSILSMGISMCTFRYQTGKYCKQTAQNGISPNFIHSLDSAHLCKVLNAFPHEIIPIHDSFAVHPHNVDELHRVLREEFIKMYTQEDVLKRLTENNVFVEEVPAPEKGDLDLNEVRTSRFMFC